VLLAFRLLAGLMLTESELRGVRGVSSLRGRFARTELRDSAMRSFVAAVGFCLERVSGRLSATGSQASWGGQGRLLPLDEMAATEALVSERALI
jgi:hypothetical protein